MSAAQAIATPDLVNTPPHYTQYPLECIDIAEQLSYPLGNAVKYCWRHRSKGTPAQDLRKAAWYIRREAARLKRAGVLRRMFAWLRLRQQFALHHAELPPLVHEVLQDVLEGAFERATGYLEGIALVYE